MLPSHLRDIAYQNKRAVYDRLMCTAAATPMPKSNGESLQAPSIEPGHPLAGLMPFVRTAAN
jgi:hypothetical protein